VVRQHRAVVHFVDMVAGQNEHVLGLVDSDDVEVLIDRVRGTGIPGRFDPLLRRQQFDEFAELATQEAELDTFFDHVIVCTVTGSSHAGMIAGFALEDRAALPRERRVIGIDASATLDKTVDQVTRIAQNTATTIDLGRDLRHDEITVVPGYAGPAYGIPDQQTIDAIHLTARTEGMLTDPVYEGKSMAGLIGMIRSGEIPTGSKVLYCHLGGQPCLSAYAGARGLG